jgi:hypothetical protein
LLQIITGHIFSLLQNSFSSLFQVSEARRGPYQELAANKFTQTIFLLTQRLPHMLTSLACVLGYLAAIPEGGGVLGKKAMATLTHMSTGKTSLKFFFQSSTSFLISLKFVFFLLFFLLSQVVCITKRQSYMQLIIV